MVTKPPRKPASRNSARPGVKRDQRSRTPKSAGSSGGGARTAGKNPTPGLTLVQRTIAVVATFALLLVSFVSSFSVYLGQQRDIAQVREQIAQQRAEIERLQDELERWQDPAYVRAQARDRLGWVMPGEVGYRVVDENGQVIGGTMTDPDGDSAAVSVTWYEALRDSLKVADQPVPDAQEPEDSRIFDPDDDESPR